MIPVLSHRVQHITNVLNTCKRMEFDVPKKSSDPRQKNNKKKAMTHGVESGVEEILSHYKTLDTIH